MMSRLLGDRAHKAGEQWARFGTEDPYFGVLSHDRFRRENIDDCARDEFFASGRAYIDDVATMAEQLGRPPRWTRVLDFGCGVGRLLAPLAERAERAVGVDVSPGMLAEARRSCEARGIDNALLIDPSRLDQLDADFDLITSQLVFQHIPPSAGYALARRLTALLAPGGVAVLQFTLTPSSLLAYPFYWTLRSAPHARRLWNVVRGRAGDYPFMEMNSYRLERLLSDLASAGIDDVTIRYTPAPQAAAGARGSLLTAFDQATLSYARPRSDAA